MNSTEPTVQVEGRRVTIQFDMPFVPGEACITPRHGSATTVSRAPEAHIELVMEGPHAKAKAHFGGAWYTANHSQCHGVGEFLPNREAFLKFWLRQDAGNFISRLKWLQQFFAGDAGALETLRVHRLNLLRGLIELRHAELASASLTAAREIVRLEEEIAALEGARQGATA
jgi:hypothetical protein